MLYFCCVCRSTSAELKRQQTRAHRAGHPEHNGLHRLQGTYEYSCRVPALLAYFGVFLSLSGGFWVFPESFWIFWMLQVFCGMYWCLWVMQGLIIPPLGSFRLCLCVFRVLWCVWCLRGRPWCLHVLWNLLRSFGKFLDFSLTILQGQRSVLFSCQLTLSCWPSAVHFSGSSLQLPVRCEDLLLGADSQHLF